MWSLGSRMWDNEPMPTSRTWICRNCFQNVFAVRSTEFDGDIVPFYVGSTVRDVWLGNVSRPFKIRRGRLPYRGACTNKSRWLLAMTRGGDSAEGVTLTTTADDGAEDTERHCTALPTKLSIGPMKTTSITKTQHTPLVPRPDGDIILVWLCVFTRGP